MTSPRVGPNAVASPSIEACQEDCSAKNAILAQDEQKAPRLIDFGLLGTAPGHFLP
jgi:hypothetical protein